MDFATFHRSLEHAAPPTGLSAALQGLWWDAKGDWERAHVCAQADGRSEGAVVHGYLHRKEGDADNARYWYSRAGRAAAEGALDAEWETLVRELLPRANG